MWYLVYEAYNPTYLINKLKMEIAKWKLLTSVFVKLRICIIATSLKILNSPSSGFVEII